MNAKEKRNYPPQPEQSNDRRTFEQIRAEMIQHQKRSRELLRKKHPHLFAELYKE
jgi:hypothetical protein